MLIIKTPDTDYFNDETSEFTFIKGRTIRLEHSLISLSKWESKWCKPFLGKESKTDEEARDYIRCMIIDGNVPDDIVYSITDAQINQINDYMQAKMTATIFSDFHRSVSKSEIVTAELIYYWMIAFNIPFECQKWHLNRLLTLIRVCSIKNTPPKKMPKGDILRRNKALNAARRQQYGTKG